MPNMVHALQSFPVLYKCMVQQQLRLPIVLLVMLGKHKQCHVVLYSKLEGHNLLEISIKKGQVLHQECPGEALSCHLVGR